MTHLPVTNESFTSLSISAFGLNNVESILQEVREAEVSQEKWSFCISETGQILSFLLDELVPILE